MDLLMGKVKIILDKIKMIIIITKINYKQNEFNI
jgi:hypothetical protein